uniref:Uncharacterized protein n=1 Tax=Pundamilia nyererei TaxID=303518 RepID=A0A3B4HCG7_9CICH
MFVLLHHLLFTIKRTPPPLFFPDSIVLSIDVNGVYPCRKWKDYITPLIAAVVNDKRAICSYLLDQGADPNIPSQLQRTPLQFAAIEGRKEIVENLISAGAVVTLPPINDPQWLINSKKISQIINDLASNGDQVYSQIRHFLDMEIAVVEKTFAFLQDVFAAFNSGKLSEDPRLHLTMIEILFTVTGRGKDKYCQACIKWLKETGNVNTYNAGAARRFPNIPKTHVGRAVESLNAVSQVSQNQASDCCKCQISFNFINLKT